MKKAIKITQENIDNNQHLFKNKKVGDVVVYTENNFPTVFNNGTVNFKADLKDFYDYEEPIIEPIEPTAQQLYDALIIEGKQVFDDFSLELSKAAIPYNILNNHPEELKALTMQLLQVKEEIKVGLKYYLDNNMINELKSFNYHDERAVELKQAIENFK